MSECPLCGYELEREPHDVFETNGKIYLCPNCGCFELPFESQTNLPSLQMSNPKHLAILSHAVRKMSSGGERWPKLDWELVESILVTTKLPSPTEQVENLLLWLADNTEFGERLHIIPQTHSATVGVTKPETLVAVAQALMERGLARGDIVSGAAFLGELTFAGWQAAEELKRGTSDSRKAFMAMAYGDPELDAVFAECFRPAVEATGFSLRLLSEAPPAGLIDDRLRVEIRTSRFLIADLTHENRGAYWEAGFAEGIGRPVIYTCEKGYFKKPGTHFDTSHHHTIRWERDNLAAAAEQLKATIRATLPAEAVLEDAPDEYRSEPPLSGIQAMKR
jgi:hypothetical protein